MEALLTYPQLLNINDTSDINLLESVTSQGINSAENDTLYTIKEEMSEQAYTYDNSLYKSPHSYLKYLQAEANDNNASNTLPDISLEQQQSITDELILNLIDYDYVDQTTGVDLVEQKEEWSCEPADPLIPPPDSLFCDDNMSISIGPFDQPSFDCFLPNSYKEEYSTTPEGTMSQGYVSLSDVNAFVAKADSEITPCFSLYGDNLLLNEFILPPQYDLLSSESTNEDTEDDSYSETEESYCWSAMEYTSLNSAAAATVKPKRKYTRRKSSIKSLQSTDSNAFLGTYDINWDLLSSKVPKSARKKTRKSMPDIHGLTKKKSSHKGRRGSVPHRIVTTTSSNSLSTLNSSSSLSSLANNMQHSMRVSDSFNSLLSQQSLDIEEQDNFIDEGEEDYNDDDYQYKCFFGQPSVKKGRNVDKACNHCKRSHLRCDDMRPCRRCVATGKLGCRDVQHKPRGRPRLNKKQPAI